MRFDIFPERPARGGRAAVAAAVVVWLLPVSFAGEARADDYVEARAVMQQITDRLLERLQAEQAEYEKDETRLYRMLEDVVLPAVDMDLFSRYALRSHWENASQPQKRRFIEGFQAMLMKSYGKQLLLLSGIEIEPGQAAAGKKYQVIRTKAILKGNAAPLSIDYLMMNRGGWKVVDIIIDSTSMIKQFRASFDQEIGETGFEALLDRLGKFDS